VSQPWPIVRFGDILVSNKRPYQLGETEDANLVGMRLYGVGPFHRERKPAIQIRKKSHFVIKGGDVIYNKLFAWKGTFGVVPPELDGMFVSDKFPTYEADLRRVDLDYLKWYFRYPAVWDQAKNLSKGAAALSKLTLNPSDFPKLLIPLPPHDEQRRIVAKIEALAAKIEEAKRLRKAVEREQKAISTSAISTILEELSYSGRLEDMLLGPPRNGWSPRCDGLDTGTQILSLGALTGFWYRSDQCKWTSESTNPDAHYWLKPGDLLISRSNTPELVGHAAIYNGIPSPCIYPDLLMLLRLDKERCDSRFAHYVLQTRIVREFIKTHAKGTSPTMKKISQGIVIRIPFPTSCPKQQQIEVVNRLDAIRISLQDAGKTQEQSAKKLDALLPAILDRAFKGEL
jgi:type I restriction enzyme, S subunit